MAKWAYVENDVVVEQHEFLPQNWRNISNFFVLEDEPDILRSHGWYPVINISEPMIDNIRQRYGETKYTFEPEQNIVTQKTEIENLEFNETEYFQQQRESFMGYLRRTRNELLSGCDWTQAIDIQEIKSAEWKQSWKDYRQQLRDFPEYYNTNYPNEINIGAIQFPLMPQD